MEFRDGMSDAQEQYIKNLILGSADKKLVTSVEEWLKGGLLKHQAIVVINYLIYLKSAQKYSFWFNHEIGAFEDVSAELASH